MTLILALIQELLRYSIFKVPVLWSLNELGAHYNLLTGGVSDWARLRPSLQITVLHVGLNVHLALFLLIFFFDVLSDLRVARRFGLLEHMRHHWLSQRRAHLLRFHDLDILQVLRHLLVLTVVFSGLAILGKLGVDAEGRLELEGVQKEQQHVIQFDPVLLVLVDCVIVMGLRRTAHEVDKLGK